MSREKKAELFQRHHTGRKKTNMSPTKGVRPKEVGWKKQQNMRPKDKRIRLHTFREVFKSLVVRSHDCD